MTDEENEAIIDFEREVEDGRLLDSDILLSLNTGLTILNLIEKQSKEIEELQNADLTIVYLNGVYDGEKKVEDKIKAKIEELEEAYEDNYIINILQSLLEKE